MRVPRNLLVTALATTMAASLAAGCGGGDEPQKTVAADAPKPTPVARRVAIVVDGKRTEVTTAAATVREALTQAGITLGRYDLVAPPADAAPGSVVKVRRLLSKPVIRKVVMPQKVVRKQNRDLAPFSRKVLRKGRPGIKIVKVAYVPRPVRRGRVKKVKKVKAIIAQKIVRRPVTKVIAMGPKAAAGGSVASLNWPALASCESHGNPRAVNPAGYYGLYQFSMSSWASVGGIGRPSDAPAAEQTYRAQLLYKRVGGRWQGQWPNCGRFLFS